MDEVSLTYDNILFCALQNMNQEVWSYGKDV